MSTETPAESNAGMPAAGSRLTSREPLSASGAGSPDAANTPPVHEHEIIAPLPAEIQQAQQPAYGVVAHYVGAGYYLLPGLPGRDLTARDLEGSGWTLEKIVDVKPPVYVKAAPTSAISQADRPAGA